MKATLCCVIFICVTASRAQNFWNPVSPSATYVVAFDANSQGALFAASFTSGVHRSTDGGTSWVQVNSGLLYNSAMGLAVNAATGDLFVSSGNRIYRSTNGGGNWDLQDSTTFPYGAYRLAISDQGTLFASPNSSDSLRRSTDNGITWAIAHNGLPYGVVQDLRPHGASGIYAAMHNDWVFRSTDDGDTWLPFQPPIAPPFVDADAVEFGTSGEIFVGDDGQGFFRSTNDGASWEQLNSGLPNQYVWALAVSNQGNIFAGLARDGIYRSTSGGAQWDSINTGLDALSRRVYSLWITPSGHLLAGTTGGIYRSTQPVTDVGTDVGTPTIEYFLSQNYPNPFNPTTRIRYATPIQNTIVLNIYDVLGREVAILVKGVREKGTYEVEWNAGSLPSGVYLCRLQAGGFAETKKLFLLR